jgi:site-specific DNA recombinase
VRNPLDGIVHQEERPSEETDKWTRQLPHLRLVDDETWEAAQKILKKNKQSAQHRHQSDGRWKGSRPGDSADHPRHLLSGLLQCACGAFFIVGGANGKYLLCPSYAEGTCACKTQLRRDVAKKLIHDTVSRCILSQQAWKEAVLQEAVAAWKLEAVQQPVDVRRLEKELADVDRKIQRLLDSLENGEDPDIRQRLQERRRDKESLTRELRRAQQVPEKPTAEPTLAWVEEHMRNLSDLLQGEEPAAARALRKLVGGKIPVREIREPGRKRFFLRGTLAISMGQMSGTLAALHGRGSCDPGDPSADQESSEALQQQDGGSKRLSKELDIDFRTPTPLSAEADRAKELYDQNLLSAQIAARMGCARNHVTKLLQFWHESRGLVMLDGRKRRATLAKKQTGTPLHEALADEAKSLWDEELADVQIAERLGCSPPTAVAAVEHWFRSHGQSMPSHEDRRRYVMDRMVRLYEEGKPLRAIAVEVGMCSRSVTLLLRERLQQDGRIMQDGRNRRRKQ